MLRPAIIYYISTIINENNKYNLYISKKNIDDNKLIGISIIPDTDCERSVLDGNNIDCTKYVLRYKGEEYCFDELALGIENDICYLITENEEKKLWHLPNKVISFLDLDRYIDTSYSLSVDKNTQKPILLKEIKTNTNPSISKLIYSKEIMLREQQYNMVKNNQTFPTTFFYYDSENINEIIKKSYIDAYNSKYYFKDLYIYKKNENTLGVYSKIFKLNDQYICDTITPCLGIINEI